MAVNSRSQYNPGMSWLVYDKAKLVCVCQISSIQLVFIMHMPVYIGSVLPTRVYNHGHRELDNCCMQSWLASPQILSTNTRDCNSCRLPWYIHALQDAVHIGSCTGTL